MEGEKQKKKAKERKVELCVVALYRIDLLT